jgi:hypothetical protein
MTSCPWLNEHGFTAEAPGLFIDHHVIPCAMDAAGAVETALEDVREQVRAEPRKALIIAALAGFVFGLTFTAARR